MNAAFVTCPWQVDVNVQNKNGWTPLMWTAITGQVELAELLIQAASDIYKRDAAGLQREVQLAHGFSARCMVNVRMGTQAIQ